MALIDIKVPDIGDFDEVAVIELLVKAGDVVKAEQSLITVESDKASMEIPCSQAGVVKEIKVKLGDKVKQGSVVLVLEGEATASAAAPAASAPPPAATPQTANKAPATKKTPWRLACAKNGKVSAIKQIASPANPNHNQGRSCCKACNSALAVSGPPAM